MESIVWKTLLSSSKSVSLPPLLVKYSSSLSVGYSIYLTDLTNIWLEKLNKTDIIGRAIEIDTSIDPSADLGQYEIFLSKIEESISGIPNTCLRVSRGQEDGGLNLHTSSRLPEPLAALEWSFRLALAPSGELKNQLISPLLADYNDKVWQINALADKLKEKDHVISKLIDKLTLMGLNLDTIFPSAAKIKLGKDQTLREVAGKRVPGLEEFRGLRLGENDRDGKGTNNETFPNRKVSTEFYVDLGEQRHEDKDLWWEQTSLEKGIDLNVSNPLLEEYHTSKKQRTSNDKHSDKQQNSQDSTTFEAHRPSLENSKQSKATDDPGTDIKGKSTDGKLVSSQPMSNKTTESRSVSRMSSEESLQINPKKIGTIGGSKIKQESKEYGSLPRNRAYSVDNESHASDHDTEEAPKGVSTRRRGGRLGVIGGGHDRTKQGSTTAAGLVTSASQLGHDGSNVSPKDVKAEPISEAHPDLQNSEDNVTPEASDLRTRETSVERADRRREELKKELERNKAPAKKKRRF